MAPIIFYHDIRSIPSRFVLLVFRNLDLKVEIINIDLWKDEQLTQEFIKINPEHVVPTIDDNGFILWESNAIAQYLVETYAPKSPLYPKDTKARAIVNQRLQFYMGTLLQIIKTIVVPIFKGEEDYISDSKRTRLYEAFRHLDRFLRNSDWIAGSHVTLADLACYASISTIVSFGADAKEYPFLSSWMEKCEVLQGFKENSKGVTIFTGLFQKLYSNNI
ncbi:hypothetical protein ACFFRR_004565 [Megaselia abdita]